MDALNTPRLEVVQMFEIKNKIKFVVGKKILNDRKPNKVFDKKICSFINEISKEILSDPRSKKYSDLVAFAFWCREKNISKVKAKYSSELLRIGLGTLFHNCPSNIPLNFAYSFIFGLITGNNNIIKMPNQNFSQSELLCKIISKNLNKKKFKFLKNKNIFIKYDYIKYPQINEYFSLYCDGRLIWGSDDTIQKFKVLEVRKKNIDVFFPDRNSLSIINSNEVCKLSNLKLKNLCTNFYNDTYLVDQNACSSPQLIIWIGRKINLAQKKFWRQLKEIILNKGYFLDFHSISKKYLNFSKTLISLKNIESVNINDQFIYLINLKYLSQDLSNFQINMGIFLQIRHDLKKNINLKLFINKNLQTMTYFGFKKKELENILSNIDYAGVDRVVPIGSALDMTFNWDGYDLISKLSRIVEIR